MKSRRVNSAIALPPSVEALTSFAAERYTPARVAVNADADARLGRHARMLVRLRGARLRDDPRHPPLPHPGARRDRPPRRLHRLRPLGGVRAASAPADPGRRRGAPATGVPLARDARPAAGPAPAARPRPPVRLGAP